MPNQTSGQYSYEDTMDTVRSYLHGLAFSMNLFLGLPINSYVVSLILRRGRDKICADFILLNQILVEILLCPSALLFFLDRYLHTFPFKWLFHLFCGMFFIKRPLVQTFVCLEQYLAEVHPFIFLWCKPLKYKAVCLGSSWLAVLTGSITGMVQAEYVVFFRVIAAFYFLLLSLMVFCCVSVLIALKRPGPGVRHDGQHKANKKKRKAFNLILSNVLQTVLSQLTMVFVSCLIGVIDNFLFFALSSANTVLFVITGFVPSFLYLCRMTKLHRKCRCV